MPETATVPHVDIDAVWADAAGRLARTPRELVPAGASPDPEAMHSALLFGGLVPPLAPWTGLRRLRPGYAHLGSRETGPIPLPLAMVDAQADSEAQADALAVALDATLVRGLADRRPVLLFSGGVDSGLLAARLAALGRRDALLVNYAFGPEDEESHLAEAMARHLGLPFVRVSIDRDPCACLEAPGRIWAAPFGDPSVVPTSELAQSVVDHLTAHGPAPTDVAVIDGTGADGGFGLSLKLGPWLHLEQIPRSARRVVAAAIGWRAWRRHGRQERWWRVLRRSARLPFLSAVLSRHPLDGLLIHPPSGGNVHTRLEEWISGWSGDGQVRRVVAADLALVCANIFAQKGLPILRRAGCRVVLPFLDRELVSLALGSLGRWHLDQPKAPLKRLLARSVPAEMVYRRKCPFADPRERVYHQPGFIAKLRAAADASAPVAPVVDQRRLVKACDLLHARTVLPEQTLACLWSIAFTDSWYRSA